MNDAEQKPLITNILGPSKSIVTRKIGYNMRRIRTKRGLSQKDTAKILGISYQQLQKYERGQDRLSTPMLFTLKHFFDIPYDTFFRGIDPPPS